MFISDLRYSARSLARTPGLTFVLLLTIALGIGANASVFGFIRGSVARPVTLPHGGTIVSLFSRSKDGQLGPISFERYASLKAQHDAFRSVGAARESQRHIVLDGRSSFMTVAAITRELADLLQLPTDQGVVISHRVWRLELGSKAPVRGEPIQIDDIHTRVAGIASERLEGLYVGRMVDVWMPLREDAIQGFDRSSRTLWGIGRLPDGISRNQAQAAASVDPAHGDDIAVMPYTGMTPDVSGGIELIAKLLPAAAVGVFLIACANVAGFLLSRASARAVERSLRTALGASRRQLGLQLLADSVVVTIIGGAFAVLLAFWAARIVPALLFDQDAERMPFAPDAFGIVGAGMLCAAITVVCGLLPLLEIRHDDPASVLQRESAGPSRMLQRLRHGLVIGQMTGCCLLVISTALLFERFQSALRTRTGHQVGERVLATVQTRFGFTTPDLGFRYFHDAERAAQSVPGIYATAWTATLPGGRASWYDMRIEPAHRPVREVELDVITFTPRFATLTTLVAGRMFGIEDMPGGCRVAIVNREAAEDLFHGDAIGRSIEDPTGERLEIVGIVEITQQRNDSSPRGVARTSAGSEPPEPPSRLPAPAPKAERSVPGAHQAPAAIYYYGEQIGSTSERTTRAIFRVPVIDQRPSAVLSGTIVSPNYFDTVGMPVTAGGVFTENPRARGCRVGVVNQEAAELFFGGDAIGGAVIDASGRRTEIVGVVQSPTLRSSQRREEATVYFPMRQNFRRLMTMILSARGDPEALVPAVHRQLELVDGGDPQAPPVVTTLDAHLSRTALASERIAAVLVGACATTALALGVLGLYGALADAVRHRRREIALRLALGARHSRITSQLLMEGIRLASVGMIAGTIGALVITRWLAPATPNSEPLAVWIWLAPPVVLLTAVVLASVLPMRRAMTVNPVTLLQRN